MRITNTMLTTRALRDLQANYANLAKSQEQVATGRKLNRVELANTDGRWHFENAPDAKRTLHYVAGGAFYVTGESLDLGD